MFDGGTAHRTADSPEDHPPLAVPLVVVKRPPASLSICVRQVPPSWRGARVEGHLVPPLREGGVYKKDGVGTPCSRAPWGSLGPAIRSGAAWQPHAAGAALGPALKVPREGGGARTPQHRRLKRSAVRLRWRCRAVKASSQVRVRAEDRQPCWASTVYSEAPRPEEVTLRSGVSGPARSGRGGRPDTSRGASEGGRAAPAPGVLSGAGAAPLAAPGMWPPDSLGPTGRGGGDRAEGQEDPQRWSRHCDPQQGQETRPAEPRPDR